MTDKHNYTDGLKQGIVEFLTESNGIEGIWRKPTEEEIFDSLEFLCLPTMRRGDVENIQAVYAPGMPIRQHRGMNVRIGGHIPIGGGLAVVQELESIVDRVNTQDNYKSPYYVHLAFETLHPFMDGNGRTGRILWAWHMRRLGRDPFALSFLHRWYYESLANSDGR